MSRVSRDSIQKELTLQDRKSIFYDIYKRSMTQSFNETTPYGYIRWVCHIIEECILQEVEHYLCKNAKNEYTGHYDFGIDTLDISWYKTLFVLLFRKQCNFDCASWIDKVVIKGQTVLRSHCSLHVPYFVYYIALVSNRKEFQRYMQDDFCCMYKEFNKQQHFNECFFIKSRQRRRVLGYFHIGVMPQLQLRCVDCGELFDADFSQVEVNATDVEIDKLIVMRYPRQALSMKLSGQQLCNICRCTF